MNPIVDLARFGIDTHRLKGSVVSHSLTGRRLLFLFGERHTIRAGIKANLENALVLFDSGAISCVGVEGWKDPSEPVPCPIFTELYDGLKARHGINEEAIITGLLQNYGPNNYVFWKALTLLRPSLPIRSVEDRALFHQVGDTSRRVVDDRIAAIADFIRQSGLPFSQFSPYPPTSEQEQTIIVYKSKTQASEEFAEMDLNYQRDEAFLTNVRVLWDEAGQDKAAILNAGVSHQYRIARQLLKNPAYRDEFSYVLTEQP
jgi:hypothetical protein